MKNLVGTPASGNGTRSEHGFEQGSKVKCVVSPNSMVKEHSLQHSNYGEMTGGRSTEPMPHGGKGSGGNVTD